MKNDYHPYYSTVKKGFYAAALFLLILSSPVIAQPIHLSLGGGYMFGGRLTVREGDVFVASSEVYNVALDFGIRSGAQVEVSFLQQPTDLKLDQYLGDGKKLISAMDVRYYQIGGLYGVDQGQMQPFGLFTLGATEFNPSTSDLNTEWRFSFTMGGGIKYFFSEKVGIRLQGQLLIPIMWTTGGMWCGTGGCSVGVGGGSAILQANITGGLVYAIR